MRLIKPFYFITFCFLLLLNLNNAHSKNFNVDYDSVTDVLKSMKNDIGKVELLLEMGKHYCSRDNEKAMIFLQEAFMLSTNLKYQKGIGLSYLWLGRVYYYKDDYDISLNYLDNSIRILENLNDCDDLIFTYISKGQNYNLLGNMIEAFNVYQKAIKICDSVGGSKYKKHLLINMGNVYLNRGQALEAIRYLKKAVAMCTDPIDPYLANTYCSIGSAYESIGNNDSSLYYQYKALDIREQDGDERRIASSQYRIGLLLVNAGKYIEAEVLLEKSLQVFIKLEENTGIAITKLQLARASSYQGNSNAIQLARESLKISRDVDNPFLESKVYEVMSEIEKNQGNFERSLFYIKKHYSINDSIFTAEKERILSEYQTKFETQKKDNEIRQLKDENTIQRKSNLLYISLIVFLLFIIILIFFLFRYKSKSISRKQILLEQENVIEIQNKELSEKENTILKEQLESKNRELASKTLEMVRFNDTISSVINKLEELEDSDGNHEDSKDSIKRIIFELESHAQNDLWKEFDEIFKNIHSSFYDSLLEKCSDLTSTEIKTASLLRMNLTTKEIAAITYKSESSIKTARYRLRKKLDLSSDKKLVPYLLKI